MSWRFAKAVPALFAGGRFIGLIETVLKDSGMARSSSAGHPTCVGPATSGRDRASQSTARRKGRKTKPVSGSLGHTSSVSFN